MVCKLCWLFSLVFTIPSELIGSYVKVVDIKLKLTICSSVRGVPDRSAMD